MPPFEEIDHTADWSFHVSASSREELFMEAARALYYFGGVQIGSVVGETRTVRLQGDDLEGLLIQSLNELLFLIEHDRIALSNVRIERLTNTELVAAGQAVEILAIGKYIKAATYSGLQISEANGTWQATIVLDV